MSGEVRFSAPDAHRHAATVDGVADAVRQARSAVQAVTMDAQAYGVLCQFLPVLLSPLFGAAATALDRSAASLAGTAERLRTTATEMGSTDAAAARRVAHTLPDLPL